MAKRLLRKIGLTLVTTIFVITCVRTFADDDKTHSDLRAAGAILRTLSYFRPWRKDHSRQDLIPVSAAVEIKSTDAKQTLFTYHGATYTAPTSELTPISEVDRAPEKEHKKMLENLHHIENLNSGNGQGKRVCDTFEAQHMAIDGKDESCPINASGKLQRPANDWTNHLIVEKCASPSPQIITRESTGGAFSPSCRSPRKQDFIHGSTWKACPPAPACDAAQTAVKQKLEARRLTQDRQLHCSKKNKKYRKIDDGPACLMPLADPTRIVIHETGVDAKFGPNVIQNAKMQDGYTDLPYHFMLAPAADGTWKIFEGRPLKFQGAHAGAGLNSDSLAIAIAGEYEAGTASAYHPAASSGGPPPAAVALLSSLVSDLKSRYPSLKTVSGHGELKHAGARCFTSCPSPECQKLVNRLRERYFDGLDPDQVPIRYSSAGEVMK